VNDRDLSDYLSGPYGDCTDCGRVCEGGLCDECCDRRDAHTDALEVRMAKADLPLSRRRDVA
jgi:hypothetical protein